MIFSPTLSDVPTCSGISTYKDKQCSFCKVRIMIITIIISVMSHFLALTAGWIFSVAKQTFELLFALQTPCKQRLCFPEVRLVLRSGRPSQHTASIFRGFVICCAWIRWEYDDTFVKLSFLLWRHSDSSPDGSCFSQWILPINRSLRYRQRYDCNKRRRRSRGRTPANKTSSSPSQWKQKISRVD